MKTRRCSWNRKECTLCPDSPTYQPRTRTSTLLSKAWNYRHLTKRKKKRFVPFYVWTDWLWFLSFKPQRETILFLFNLPSFICCLCYFLFVFFRVVNDLLTEQMNKFHSLSHGVAFWNRPGAVICGYFLPIVVTLYDRRSDALHSRWRVGVFSLVCLWSVTAYSL